MLDLGYSLWSSLVHRKTDFFIGAPVNDGHERLFSNLARVMQRLAYDAHPVAREGQYRRAVRRLIAAMQEIV